MFGEPQTPTHKVFGRLGLDCCFGRGRDPDPSTPRNKQCMGCVFVSKRRVFFLHPYIQDLTSFFPYKPPQKKPGIDENISKNMKFIPHLFLHIFSDAWTLIIYEKTSPLKLPWWGRAPSNCRGTLSFLYKMGGPGWRHLYKMECAKKTLENDRAPTYTGDSWWIEKFEAISIMFGGHMSMYKNKDSFCRHVPGLQNE